MQDGFWMPRCSSAARGVALVAGREAVAGRDAAGRDAWSESRVTRERRPVGSAPNTFLLRALSRVILLDVPLMTTEQTQEPTHRIPPSLLDGRYAVRLKIRQAAHHVLGGGGCLPEMMPGRTSVRACLHLSSPSIVTVGRARSSSADACLPWLRAKLRNLGAQSGFVVKVDGTRVTNPSRGRHHRLASGSNQFHHHHRQRHKGGQNEDGQQEATAKRHTWS
jgi:hypothetical protein